jgi:hypothetical protein
VAALIKDEVGVDAELVEGARGEFTVWIGDETVARKDSSDSEIVASVRKALGRQEAPK